MTLQLALLEPLSPATTGRIVGTCVRLDSPLHLIGEVEEIIADPECVAAGPADWNAADIWIHREWRAFRDAVVRERCLYFSADGDREISEAPIRANSVLVIGDEAGMLPERIRAKYPRRIYRLPGTAAGVEVDLVQAVTALLEESAAALAAVNGKGRATPTSKVRYGRGRVRART